MATRPMIAAAALVAGLGVAACGDEEDEFAEFTDSRQARRIAKVERLVDEGALPPVALRLFDTDGTLKLDFVDGPKGDEDVVRASADGESGRKLRWDLDRDGTISAAERHITERDLYDATLGPRGYRIDK